MVNVHPDAWVSPHAILTGEVTVGAGSRVLDLAVIHADHGPVVIGRNVVVMEHAILRGRATHPVVIGDSVLVGPQTHLNGTHVEDEVFIATGASMFPGSRAGAGSELRINSVLHVNSHLPPEPLSPSAGSRPAIQPSCSRQTGTTSCGRSRRPSTSPAPSTAWTAPHRCERSCDANHSCTRRRTEATHPFGNRTPAYPVMPPTERYVLSPPIGPVVLGRAKRHAAAGCQNYD
jgi:carbonic anhydrase/acetyltransferase-like protein (isoleucine patch superfamily)